MGEGMDEGEEAANRINFNVRENEINAKRSFGVLI